MRFPSCRSPYAKDWPSAVQAEDMEGIDAVVASYVCQSCVTTTHTEY